MSMFLGAAGRIRFRSTDTADESFHGEPGANFLLSSADLNTICEVVVEVLRSSQYFCGFSAENGEND